MEDFEEELEIPETDAEKIIRLRDKIIELESMCKAIEVPLMNAGYLDKPSISTKSSVPVPGIRINNRLSFRGKAKAFEYYHEIKEHDDIPFSFVDYRAMCSKSSELGINHEVKTTNWESWKMYMADCGIKTDVYGHVSPQEFVKYRALVENRNKPLLPELVTMQMSPLPKPQLLWSKVKVLIKEVIDHRYNNNGILRVTAPRAANLADERLTMEEVVYILANCGIAFSKSEFFRSMLERARFGAVMNSMIAKSLKANYGQSPKRYGKLLMEQYEHQQYLQMKMLKKIEKEKKRKAEEKKNRMRRLRAEQKSPQKATKTSNKLADDLALMTKPEHKKKKKTLVKTAVDVTYKDMHYISPTVLMAWIFARRPEPTYPELYQTLLKWKYSSWKWIRQTELFLYHISMLGAHIKQRKIFLDIKQEVLFPHGVPTTQGGIKAKALQGKAAMRNPDGKAKTGQAATGGDNTTGGSGKDSNGVKAKKRKSNIVVESDSDSDAENDGVEEGNGEISRDTVEEQKPVSYSKLPAAKFAKSFKERRDVKASVDCCIEVGAAASTEEGTSIAFKLSKLDSPETYYTKQNLPREITSSISVDIQIRSDMDENSIQRTAVALKIFISNHFLEELQHHPLFRGIFVYPIESELDSSAILRVTFAYKKMSVDSYLEQIYIPFNLCDLIPDFRGEFKSNIHVTDIMSNHASLDNMFYGKLELFCSVKRDVIIPLMQRLQASFSSTIPNKLVDAMAESHGFQTEQHKEYMKYIKSKQQEFQQQQELASLSSSEAGGSSTTVKNATMKALDAANANSKKKKLGDDMEFEFHFADVWKDIRPFFGVVADTAHYVSERIRGIKQTSVEFKFVTLSELLGRIGMMNKFVKYWFPLELAKSHHNVARAFKSWTNYISSNVHSIFTYAKDYLEDRVLHEERARRNALLQLNKSKKKKKSGNNSDSDDSSSEEDVSRDVNNNAVQDRLDRMGIKSVGDTLYEGDDTKPDAAIQRLNEKVIENDIQGLQTWERLWHCCLGIHNIEVVSGRSRLIIVCQGVDLMELFPEPPSIIKIKEQCEERRRAGTAKENTRKLNSNARNAGVAK